MTNILLADDHPVIRTGLKIFINKVVNTSNIDEVWECAAAYRKISDNQYSLIILDATIAGEDAYTLVQKILLLKPAANILMFSVNNEEIYAKKYFQLGVKGYLSKDATEPEIELAIENVLNNKRYISASLVKVLTDDALGLTPHNPFDDLSQREFQIVGYLLRGASAAEIGNRLSIHSSTIGTHKARILEKLKCKNIVDINLLGQMFKIIPAE